MRVKVFAAAAALVALGSAAVLAQETRRSRRAHLEALRADIGLSDEQASEIRRIHREARKAAVRRNAELRVARMELDDLMGAATLDDAQIAARVKAIYELQAAALKERTDSRLAVRRLVTPEQFQKMQQARRHAFRAHRARPGRRGVSERAPGGSGGEDPSPAEPAA